MIKIDIAKCTGCRMCETSCSFFHSGQTGRLMSRIKVVNIYETGIDGPVVCQQCRERYCMVCHLNAMSIGEYGQVVISHTVCIQCDKCMPALSGLSNITKTYTWFVIYAEALQNALKTVLKRQSYMFLLKVRAFHLRTLRKNRKGKMQVRNRQIS